MGREDYRRLNIPDEQGCMKCGAKPEIAINSADTGDTRMIIACRTCAFRIARELKLSRLMLSLLDYFEVRLPQVCPNCGRKVETATMRPPFGGQLCTHWTFKNGSLVFCPWHELPAPTKCAPCDRGWVIDPMGAVIQVPGL